MTSQDVPLVVISSSLLQHAERYATELTNQYLLERWKKDFPDLFRHVTYSIRPADTSQDYYVPAKLQAKAIVIEHDVFDEIGCAKLACFPFDNHLKDCRKEPPRWIPLGERFGLACQRACEWSSVDTEFRGGKCMQLNTLKKMLAAAPEKYLEMTSKFHAGLDLIDGQLQLNARYCHAYGVQFEDHDCIVPTGQAVAEIFMGSTVYRSIAAAQLPPRMPPNARVPRYLLSAKPFPQRTVPKTSLRRIKRSTPSQNTWATVATDVAKDVSIEMGVDVSVDVVAYVLKKRLPSFLLKKSLDIPVRSAVTRAVVQSHAKTLASLSSTVGKGLNAANVVLVGYGLVMMLLDIIDPFEYNRFLTKEELQTINQRLDEDFFGRLNGFEVEITPTYAIHHILEEEDQSEQWEYFEDRVREYLHTLQNVPQTSQTETGQFQKPLLWISSASSSQKWMNVARTGSTVILLILAFTLPEYVGVLGCLILAVYCFHHRWIYG